MLIQVFYNTLSDVTQMRSGSSGSSKIHLWDYATIVMSGLLISYTFKSFVDFCKASL